MKFALILFLTNLLYLSCLSQISAVTLAKWKEGNLNVPFLNSSTGIGGSHGYIDTFSIKETHFRVIHHDSLYDGIIERLENDKWVLNVEFPFLGNHNSYDRSFDVNNDGYKDIVYWYRWTTAIFLYNPRSKRFFKNSFDFGSNWELLDTSKGLYCNFYEAKFIRDYQSQLYFFKNYRPTILYYLKFDVVKNVNDIDIIKSIRIFKKMHSGKDQCIKKINIYSEKFDYSTFWRKLYKKLFARTVGIPETETIKTDQ